MKCEECQTLLEDYVDGVPHEIGEKAGALVNAHVTACSECASFREQLIHEQTIYARYERDVEVTPMLWSSIESRIKQERAAQPARQIGFFPRLREQFVGMFAAPRLSPAFTFALVLIAIAATVIVMTRMNPRVRELAINNSNVAVPEGPGTKAPDTNANNNSAKAPKDNAPVAPSEKSTVAQSGPIRVNTPRKSAAAATLTPAQLVREAEQKYLTAIAMLSRDVNRKRSQLDQTMLARFDSALGDIDRTIKDTRRVVRDNPEDPIALQYLLAAYSKKVDVLRGMSAATD